MSIMETPRFAEIRVHGSDAGSFLHSQLTCDVKALATGACRFGAYCSADGRVQALFLLGRGGDDEFRLLLPQALAQPVVDRLQRFRLRARCAFAVFPVDIGADPGDAASAGDSCLWQHAGFRWRVRSLPDGTQAQPLPAELWHQQVRIGTPWLLPPTSERFLPQMLGLERLHAYSLRKGCYPGQEVIARTHFLGRSKRRLAHVRASDPATPWAAGSDLALVDGATAAGTLIVCDDSGNGLAVLVESATPGCLLRLSGADTIATLVIEGDVSETIGDITLNGCCDPPSSA